MTTLPPVRQWEGRSEYVTLFDSVYLPQGLALHESIQRYDPGAQLTVYAMDRGCIDALTRISASGLEIRSGWERVPPDIMRLRAQRDWVSLLWTCTPFVIADALGELPLGASMYYVDADMALFRDPAPVKREFEGSGSDVLLTAHNFAADYDAAHSVGEFAVQFLGVRRGGAESIVADWSQECLAACPSTPVNGAFGDQKYLDAWPGKFPGRVHVASDAEWFQGPWNAVRFPASRAIAYHFHGLRLMAGSRVRLTTHYRLPDSTVESLYVPYVAALSRAMERLRAVGVSIPIQASQPSIVTQARQLAGRVRRVWRTSGGSRFLPLSQDNTSSRTDDADGQ